MQLSTLVKLANEISSASLFTSGGTLHPNQIKSVFAKSWKYDCGKYQTSKKNKEVDIDTDEPIWYETRTDSNGPYLQLLCVKEEKLTDSERLVYERIIDIWQAEIHQVA